MAVTSNANGIIFPDNSYQTKAASSAYSRSGYVRSSYSGANLTLTSSSAPVQSISFDGLYYIVTLPDATTLTPAGAPTFKIVNIGKYSFSIYNNGGYKLYEIYPGESVNLFLLTNNDTNGLWATDEGPIVGACGIAVLSSITPHVPNYQTNTNNRMRIVGLTNTKFLIVYAITTTQSAAVVCTVEGLYGITYGTPVNFDNGWRLQDNAGFLQERVTTYYGYPGLIKIDDNTVLAQMVNSNGYKYLVSITISGTTPTLNTNTALQCGATGYWGGAWLINSSTGMVVLQRRDNRADDGYGNISQGNDLLQSVTVSGSTITAKSSLGIYSNLNAFTQKIIHCGTNVFVEITSQFTGGYEYAYARPFTVDTTTGAFTTGTVKAFNQSVGVTVKDYGFMFSPYGQRGVSLEAAAGPRFATFVSDGSTLSGYSKSSANLPPDFVSDMSNCGNIGIGYPSGPNPTGQRMVYAGYKSGIIYSLEFRNDGLYSGYDVVGKTPILPMGSETYPEQSYTGNTFVTALANNIYVTVGWWWVLDVPYITAAVIRTPYID